MGDNPLSFTGDGICTASPHRVAAFRHPFNSAILRARAFVLGVTGTIENYVLEKGYVTP